MKFKHIVLIITVNCCFQSPGKTQTDTSTYYLELNHEKVNITGKDRMGMTINHTIPGPTLRFKEDGYAVIYVTNNMNVETSIHWHGILLPNFFDGVPYLTTPPIMPGKTLKYEFSLRQAGTYWYHSHTMLQEQSGVYGAIVIEPNEKSFDYDQEQVIVLSDWTDEKPHDVLRFLKRGTEWYNWKKGTATPLNQVISRGAFGAQLNFWKQRMESADIADVYYPAFLINGQPMQEYPEFKPGERVRLRVINGSASTQYWLTFGGERTELISADGLDVVPVERNKTFIAIAETYDFILTIPENGKLEFRAIAQDGSGESCSYFGVGEIINAPIIPPPDKIGMMKEMAEMDMRMGAPAIKFRPKKEEKAKASDNANDVNKKMKEKWGMHMDHTMEGTNMSQDSTKMEMVDSTMHHDPHHQHHNIGHDAKSQPAEMGEMHLFSEYNYDYLKSAEKTTLPHNAPVKEILLNLTGNMNRYIWSMNGIPLSETDNIKIVNGQITRITLNNLTMMHHPMHLHGHFFRVINKHGEHSPLKHTINVPPMGEVTIEFYSSESGDWFFHCHQLYHMMSGMNRIFSYGTARDSNMLDYPVSKLIHETNRIYAWGTVEIASHFIGMDMVFSNNRNQFNVSTEFGYNENYESEITYERYMYDYVSVFIGGNAENRSEDILEETNLTAVAGIRWLTPYMFNLDLRIDSQLRPRISLERSIMVFPKFSVFGYYEYQIDPNWTNRKQDNAQSNWETVWKVGAQYLLSKNFSLMVSYESRFGVGGGIAIQF